MTDINDIAFDSTSGKSPEYQLRVKSTPVSVAAPSDALALLIGAAKSSTANLSATSCPVKDKLQAVSAFRILATRPDGHVTSLEESKISANKLFSDQNALQELKNVIFTAGCETYVKQYENNPIVMWLARVEKGTHTATFNVNLEPNFNFRFDLKEIVPNEVVDYSKKNSTKENDLTWRCGESDILTLSAGPMYTELPTRTYTSQSSLVPGGITTQNILVINESTNILGATLLNYHPPQLLWQPDWLGVSISVGPVYTLGNAPNVSKLGFFSGISIHMYRSLYLTPGVHVGQFADYPPGFSRGSVVPAGFGTLTPITRNTVRFAFGITFKTTTFKSGKTDSVPEPKKTEPTKP